MEFETYADVIDAYNANDMGYSSLTDYIKDQNIKIKEIDMDPMGDFEKILGKKDGGLMYANGGGVGSMMQPKKKFDMQGGVRNYLGNQKEVKAPLNWQSGPDHPSTELAYITQKEKYLLVKKDLHNSLKGGVNRGPSGIMSLNGWGSTDPGQNVSGATASAAETGGKTERDRADFRAAGMSPQLQQDFRSAAINAGAGQRVNPGFFDSSTFLSPAEIAQAKEYRNRRDPNTGQLANRFANQAYKNTGQTGIMNMIKRGGFFGNLIRSLGQKFGLGKRYDDTSTSISENFNNNLPLGGSAAFNNLDIRNKWDRNKSVIPNNKLPPASEYEGMWDGRNNFANPGGTTNSNFAIPGGIYEALNFANPGGTTNSNFANPGGDAFPYKNSINNAAMEVMSNAYKDKYYGGAPGDNPTSVYEASFGLNYPGGEPRAVIQNDKNPLNEDARFASLTGEGLPVNSFNSVFNQNTGDPYSNNFYDQDGNYIGQPVKNGGIMGYYNRG